MAAIPDIPICILAGGTSQRFGSNKALARLGEKPMVQHVIDRLRPQTTGPIAINANTDSGLSSFGCPIIPDTVWIDHGPLSGVVSALEWALQQDADRVLTVAVDVPFLTVDFVSKLTASKGSAIAATQGQWHPVNAVWQVTQLQALNAFLASGKRSAHGWAEFCEARVVSFECEEGSVDPFWNINTPEDMIRAESMLKNG